MDSFPLIKRIVLRNFKNISACDVAFGPLTFLVGSNGSGKSNFLDSLRFVADSLQYSVDHALRDRGGIGEVRRRSSGHPTNFGLRIEYQLPSVAGHYAFEIAAKTKGAYAIQHEECFVRAPKGPWSFYKLDDGRVTNTSVMTPPAAVNDRLYLVNVSGLPEFRPIYDAFSHMGFYNLNPAAIRDLQSPDPGELLSRTGSNLASVLSNIKAHNPSMKLRIEEFLGKVVPGVVSVDPKIIGPKETIEFRQEVSGSVNPWRFLGASMSDGTLRALGILVGLFQTSSNGSAKRVRVVGIEEPETALHPAAAGVLTDALRDASQTTQIMVTSHSPDLLDNESVSDDCILAVVSVKGESHIGPLDTAGRNALRDHLYTAGELLRMDQLQPDQGTRYQPNQISLFDPPDSDPCR